MSSSTLERYELIERLHHQAIKEDSCRRWAYEIEANLLGNASKEINAIGEFDLKADQSVNSASDEWETECECDTCNHSCNCENCDIEDYGNQKCDDASATELSPMYPVLDPTHKGQIELITEAILDKGGSVDESTGGHIHVNAEDMTLQQIANVMRVWDNVQFHLPLLVGRTYGSTNGYADKVESYDIENTLRGQNANRCAVNPNNAIYCRLFDSNRKNTIEFRQFSGTLDHKTIIARGLLCRKLVEWSLRNEAPYWLLNAKSDEEVLRILGL